MARPLVIIHGWSDSSASFKNLGNKLRTRLGLTKDVRYINLADYVSLVDAITFDDLVLAMDRAWDRQGLPRDAYSVNAVVHSTGGLVIRDWLQQKCAHRPPVKNLVMLAPANFGSPVAHWGASEVSRLFFKGNRSPRRFEVGETLLKGLELASPYTWDLAMRDRFEGNPYRLGGVLCTVLVGNHGYGGIKAMVNKPGSDGTVRISTAAMRASFLKVDFSADPANPTWDIKPPEGLTGFGIMDKENHSTICDKPGNRFANPETLDFIVQALEATDKSFEDLCDLLDTHNLKVMPLDDRDNPCFQSTIVLVKDHLGHKVPKYTMEFFDKKTKTNIFTRLFQEDVMEKVHAYGDDTAYRNFLFNVTALLPGLKRARSSGLHMTLSAFPDIRQNTFVGYRTLGKQGVNPIFLDPKAVRKLFKPHQILMAELKIRREVKDEVFRFKGM